MFLEPLQTYYASVVALMVFIIFIYKDIILEKRVRLLFMIESVVILFIILATWADRVLSVIDISWAWKVRLCTTFINFAFTPILPVLLRLIYMHKYLTKKVYVLLVPVIFNFGLCVVSLINGCVFDIDSKNIYSRGKFFIVPFVIASFYVLNLIIIAARQDKKRNRIEETRLLIGMGIAVIVAYILETIFVIRFIIFSTSTICVILYFMLLSRQTSIFDELTGAYTRHCYSKKIETIKDHRVCNFAVIDIDGLKEINDTRGHYMGDEAICIVVQEIQNQLDKNSYIYRIGGDEFVIISTRLTSKELEKKLISAASSCKSNKSLSLVFSFGIAEYEGYGPIDSIIKIADERMYNQKNSNKQI